MRKRLVLTLVLAILSVAAYACASDKPADTNPTVIATATVSPAENITGEVTPTEVPIISTPTAIPTPTNAPSVTNANRKIVWAVYFAQPISEEAQKEVRRYLEEQGFDCEIEFTQTLYLGGSEYSDWLSFEKRKRTAPDILCAGVWENGIYDAMKFVEAEMVPLDDYLATEEGKKLYEAYGGVEWFSVDGKKYTAPYRRPANQISSCQLYVNNRYKEIFDAAFDGTYESLRKMCDMDTENRPVIATSAFGKRALLFFLGYSGDFRTSYNPQTQEFVNIIRQKQTKELLQTVYEDCKTGRLVKTETAAGIPENTIVYISQGPDDVPEGFTLFSVSDAQPLYTLGLSYGVAADSQRKELAMQVLGACYSNPRIASLLCWGVSDEKDWMEYTATAKAAAEPIVSLAGFVPDLTEKQYRALRRYDDDIVSLCSRMFLNSTGKPILNLYYEEALDSFFEKQNDYDDLFEVINRQWKQWAAKAK